MGEQMTEIFFGQQRDGARQASGVAVPGTTGLLHDVGHQLMTLSLLAESIRADAALAADARQRMDLVGQELVRAMEMIGDHISAGSRDQQAGPPDPLDVRDLAGRAARLAELAHAATVRVVPGEPALIRIAPTLLWRVLANLVDNAARSAGPGGRVAISVCQQKDTVIDVIDDGPGFGDGPDGLAGLGLSVVRELLSDIDSRLEIASRAGVGARARVVLCLQPDREPVPAGAGTGH
jgi:signal transduction histidine kinase